MKTIFALLFAALVINACIRAGDSAWRNYQLEDAINQEARYGDAKTVSMLRRRVVRLASEQEIALTEEEVVVEKRGQETYVSLSYAEAIELIPRLYVHEQTYDITMSVQPVRPLTDDR